MSWHLSHLAYHPFNQCPVNDRSNPTNASFGIPLKAVVLSPNPAALIPGKAHHPIALSLYTASRLIKHSAWPDRISPKGRRHTADFRAPFVAIPPNASRERPSNSPQSMAANRPGRERAPLFATEIYDVNKRASNRAGGE